jgi:hypothetical protein
VDLSASGSGWNVPGPTLARSDYENNQVFGRLFNSSDDSGWIYGAGVEVPFNNNENINGRDVVVWYKGYLPHRSAEGPTLWHSTGVRLTVHRAGSTHANRPPRITEPAAQTSAMGDRIVLPVLASDSDGDTLSFSTSGLPSGLMIDTTTGRLAGVPENRAVGTYTVTVAVSDGQASATVSFVWTVSRSSTTAAWTQRFDFESATQGWELNAARTDTASAGRWEAATPQATTSANGANGAALQLGGCAGGSRCLVTDGRAVNSAGAYNIDGGQTSIQSSAIDLSNKHTARMKFAYYFSHGANSSSVDGLRLRVLGNTGSVVFQDLGSAAIVRASWRTASINSSARPSTCGSRPRTLQHRTSSKRPLMRSSSRTINTRCPGGSERPFIPAV